MSTVTQVSMIRAPDNMSMLDMEIREDGVTLQNAVTINPIVALEAARQWIITAQEKNWKLRTIDGDEIGFSNFMKEYLSSMKL